MVKEKEIKNDMEFVWERTYFKDGSIITTKDWRGKEDKKDMMDCIEDLMERGGITLGDLLEKFSPKWR